MIAFIVIALLAAISLLSQRNADWYSGDDFYSLQVVWYIIGGVIFFGDKVGTVQALFMALTVIGVVGTKLFAQA